MTHTAVGRAMAGIGALWVATVAALAASGVIYGVGLAFAPIVWAPVIGFLAAFSLSPRVRGWALALDPRRLVLVHVLRFVGIAFLVLEQQGRLPAAFARPAGWGDLVIGVLALVVATRTPPRTARERRLFLTWNVAGLVDTLYAVMTAARLRLRNPADMAAITSFPFSLIPTVVVPLLLVTHFILIVQLRRSAAVARR